MGKNWFKKFEEMEGMVVGDYDPYASGLRSPSPSLNFIFGNTHLIPWGSSIIWWGPPKEGKSLINNFLIGQLHKDFPEALAFKFNTEFRERLQMTPLMMKMTGIDPQRYMARETNRPEEVFDFIEKDINDMCNNGAPIKLIVIDSVTDILGRRAQNADTVLTQQMGDEAATLKDGLKRIKSIVKRHGIIVSMVAQERSEFDPLEQMRGHKTKMAGAYSLKHMAEFFVRVSRNRSSKGRVNALNQPITPQAGLKDMNDEVDSPIQKIRFEMTDSSLGIAERVGELTFNKYQGIVNLHEEAFRLANARNIWERPNNRTYILKDFPERGTDAKFTSKEEAYLSIERNEDLRKEIVARVIAKDVDMFKNGIVDNNVRIDATVDVDDE